MEKRSEAKTVFRSRSHEAIKEAVGEAGSTSSEGPQVNRPKHLCSRLRLVYTLTCCAHIKHNSSIFYYLLWETKEPVDHLQSPCEWEWGDNMRIRLGSMADCVSTSVLSSHASCAGLRSLRRTFPHPKPTEIHKYQIRDHVVMFGLVLLRREQKREDLLPPEEESMLVHA